MTRLRTLSTFALGFFLGLSFQVSYATQGSNKIEEADTGKTCTCPGKTVDHKKLSLDTLPDEIIIRIADFLVGDDFHHFSLTSHPFYTTLMSYQPFFMPDNEAEIKNIINKTPLDHISYLISLWNRTPKKVSIPQLRPIVEQIQGYASVSLDHENNVQALKQFKKVFHNDLKSLNILYGLGDLTVIKKFCDVYHALQVAMEETLTEEEVQSILYPNLYKLHMKNFSLVHPKTREFLSQQYKEGSPSFAQDLSKSMKYAKDLGLPLRSEVIK